MIALSRIFQCSFSEWIQARNLESFRRILRFIFMLYYVLVIPYRICFSNDSLLIDKKFLLFNIYDYVIVDMFFLVDTVDILSRRWKYYKRRKGRTVVPELSKTIEENDQRTGNNNCNQSIDQSNRSVILSAEVDGIIGSAQRTSLNGIIEESNENDEDQAVESSPLLTTVASDQVKDNLDGIEIGSPRIYDNKEDEIDKSIHDSEHPLSISQPSKPQLSITVAVLPSSDVATLSNSTNNPELKSLRLPPLSPQASSKKKKKHTYKSDSVAPVETTGSGPNSAVTETVTSDILTLEIATEDGNLISRELNRRDSSSSFGSEMIKKEDDEEELKSEMFYIDSLFSLLLVFPFEVVAFLCLGFSAPYTVFAVPKLARLIYANNYWSKLQSILDANTPLKSSTAQRVAFTVLSMAVISHLSACVYYALSLNSLKLGDCNTWLYFDDLVTVGDNRGELKYLANERYRYLRSLYWSVQTLDTVGFGDIVAHSEPETWYCIFYFYVSALLVYLTISNLVIFINSLDLERNKYKLKLMKFDKYAKYRHLPKQLTSRIKAFYDHQWSTLRGVDENEVLSELPPNLVEQVNQVIIRDILANVSQFSDFSKALLNALSESIESFNFSPKDEIVPSQGRVAGIYIVANGELELVNAQHGFVTPLSKGEIFSLNALFKGFQSIYQLRAKSFSEVLFLRGSVFRHVCRNHLSATEYDSLVEKFALDVTIAEAQYSMDSRQVHRDKDRNVGVNLRRSGSLFHMGKNGLVFNEVHWRLYFAPDSYFRVSWDSFIFCLKIFYLTSTPLLYAAAAREFYWQHFQSLLIACYIVDFIFLMDNVLKCILFGYREKGIIITNMKSIFINYWKENNIFILFLSLVPFEFVLLAGAPLWIIPLLRSFKLLHLRNSEYYLAAVLEVLNSFFGIILSFEMTRFMVLYFALFELCHWVGCLLQLAADVSTSSLLSFDTNWRRADMESEFLDVNYMAYTNGLVSYFRSVYWAVGTMSSIGFPEILPTNPLEIVVIMLTMFCGYLLFNMLLSAIASMIGSFNKDKKEFDAKVAKVKRLLTEKSIPDDLGSKILLYYEYVWARYGGVNETEVLSSLPRSLRLTVKQYVIGPSIQAVPYFAHCSDQLVDVLVNILQPRIFLNGDFLVTYGERGTEMFIIERGTVQVCSADKKTRYALLKEGGFLGESCLLEVQKRTASAFAIGYVDTYCIVRSAFVKISEKFPEEYKSITDAVSKSLEEKKRINSNAQSINRRRNLPLLAAAKTETTDSPINKEPERNTDTTVFPPVEQSASSKARTGPAESIVSVVKQAANISNDSPTIESSTVNSVDPSNSMADESTVIISSNSLSLTAESTAFISSDTLHPTDKSTVTISSDPPNPTVESTVINSTSPTAGPIINISSDPPNPILEPSNKVLILDDPVSSNIGNTPSVSDKLSSVKSIQENSHPIVIPERRGSILDRTTRLFSIHSIPRQRLHLSNRTVPLTSPLHPDSKHRLVWNVSVFFSLLYYMIIIPIQISLSISPYVYVMDYFADALNILDNYLRWRIFPVFHGGEMLIEEEQVRQNYWSEYATADILAAIPYDIFVLAVSPTSAQFALARALLRLPKLIKCSRLGDYRLAVDQASKLLRVDFYVYYFLQITVSLVIVSIWVASIFFMLSIYHHVDDRSDICSVPSRTGMEPSTEILCTYLGTWVQLLIELGRVPSDGGSQWLRFFYSFSWSVATLTFEATEIHAVNQNESLYAFFVMFCGLSVNGAIFGSIISLVASSNEEAAQIYRKIDILRTLLTAKQVKSELIESASSTFMFLASEEGNLTLQEDILIADLPHSMKTSVDNFLKTEPYLRKCPFFDSFADDVLREISSKLTRKIYCKEDEIVTFGDLGHEMFFLCYGMVHVVSGDGKITFSTLESGAFFGETALFFNGPRTATVKAASDICICLVLTKAVLEEEMRSCDLDHEQVLDSFRALQVSNQRRNAAIQKNLALANDPTSKLSKIIYFSDISQPTPLLTKIRKYLSPQSNFRFAWDLLGFMILIYYTFSIPFFVSFVFGTYIDFYYSEQIIFDVFCDFYWVLDIIFKLTLFSFPLETNGELCTDGEQIWSKYHSSGYLYSDCLASVPLELFVLIDGVDRADIFLFRIIHLIRVQQLLSYWSRVGMHVYLKFNFFLGRATSLLLKAGFGYMIANHMFSCIYFAIHRYVERRFENTYVVDDGFATFDPILQQHDICNTRLSYCYARSIYFVLSTMTSVSYGDIAPVTLQELIWEVLLEIFSAYIAAAFLGYSTIFLENLDTAGDKSFKVKLTNIENYCNYRKIPQSLKNAITAQYTFMWETSKSLRGNSNELLTDLSEPCFMEICLQLHTEVIQSTPILNTMSHHVQRRIAAALKPQVALAHETVYRAGDPGSCVFFMRSGSLKVQLTSDRLMIDSYGFDSLKLLLQKEHVHGDIYSEGDHFGEHCFLSKTGLRPDSAKAVTKCEIYTLSKQDTWNIFQFLLTPDRRKFLHELLTRVGSTQHTPHELSEEDDKNSKYFANEYSSRHLNRMALSIFKKILACPALDHIHDEIVAVVHQDNGHSNEHHGDQVAQNNRHRNSVLRMLHAEFYHQQSILISQSSKDHAHRTKGRRKSSVLAHQVSGAIPQVHSHGAPPIIMSPSIGEAGTRRAKHLYSFDENEPQLSPDRSREGSRRNSAVLSVNGLDASTDEGFEDEDEDEEEEEDDENESEKDKVNLDLFLSMDNSKIRMRPRDRGNRRQSIFATAAAMIANSTDAPNGPSPHVPNFTASAGDQEGSTAADRENNHSQVESNQES